MNRTTATRSLTGRWHALVIFVDAHQWPAGHQVQIVTTGSATPRDVACDLYEAIKDDKPGF